MDEANLADNPWEHLYHAYRLTWSLPNRADAFAQRTRLIRHARTLLGRPHRRHAWWVLDALDDAERKPFVALAVAANVPRYFFAAMIRAGVREPDPAAKRQFIQPCVYSRGYRAVNAALLPYLEHGTADERAGTAIALCWASIHDDYFWLTGNVIGPRQHVPTSEAQAEYVAWAPLRARLTALLVTVFHETANADVRRSIVTQMFLDSAQPDDVLTALGPSALTIARHHTNRYVRRRVAQLDHYNYSGPLFVRFSVTFGA